MGQLDLQAEGSLVTIFPLSMCEALHAGFDILQHEPEVNSFTVIVSLEEACEFLQRPISKTKRSQTGEGELK